MKRVTKDESDPKCSEITGMSYDLTETARQIDTFVRTYVAFVSFVSSKKVSEAREDLVDFAGGYWTNGMPVQRAKEIAAFFDQVGKRVGRVNGHKSEPTAEDRACIAMVEASHLVRKAALVCKHEQDKEDAELWIEKNESMVKGLMALRAEKRGPWAG